jgi:hypothetical protein
MFLLEVAFLISKVASGICFFVQCKILQCLNSLILLLLTLLGAGEEEAMVVLVVSSPSSDFGSHGSTSITSML